MSHQILSLLPEDFRYTDFSLKVYGIDEQIQKTNYKDDESFENALKNTSLYKDIRMAMGNDRYNYNPIDYLPQELQEPFLKVLDEVYEGKESAKFRAYGIGLLGFMFSNSSVFYDDVIRTRERFGEYTLRNGFDYTKRLFNSANFNSQEMQDFMLFCETGEKFLSSIGALADKSILRDSDTSTLIHLIMF